MNLVLKSKIKFIEKELKKLIKFQNASSIKTIFKILQISYENYSIAKDYNGIIQLLFSGKSENISKNKGNILKNIIFFLKKFN